MKYIVLEIIIKGYVQVCGPESREDAITKYNKLRQNNPDKVYCISLYDPKQHWAIEPDEVV